MKIDRTILDNGLRVVHVQYGFTRMATVNIVYDVGSRDEDPQHTGYAHLLEHLMFGGSVNIPDYDAPLQRIGGENNAWTNTDVTNYYVTVPAQNIETAFWEESDRMLSPAFSPHGLEVQRNVVMEEFKQRYLNQPYGDVSGLMRSLAFKVHPYRWPTIGMDIDHIATATLDDVKDFFFSHYSPDNAVLVVTGNVGWDEVRHLADKWFGTIPRRDVRRRVLPQEPRQEERRFMEVERDVPVDSLYMGFHMCGCADAGYHAYDMLSDVLSNGASSNLIQHLVNERKLFASIDASVQGTADPGLLQVNGRLADGVTMQQAEDAVWQELDALADGAVDGYILDKVKNQYESSYVFGTMNYQNVASLLGWFELLGDACDIDRQVERYRAVTPAALQQAARECFRRSNASVLFYKANKA